MSDMTCYYCGKADGKHLPECPKVASVETALWAQVVCDEISELDDSRLAKAQRAWQAFMRPMTSR